MIGIVSYLLINFWFTRIQANKAAILALTMNRVGDMGLSIGFFVLFAVFGSLDYSVIFNITPLINETAITIIGLLLLSGAMAKSAQIPLHSWLPGTMEGKFFACLLLSLFYLSIFYDSSNFLFEDFDIYSSNLINLSVLPSNSDNDEKGKSLRKSTRKILPLVTQKLKDALIGELLGDGSLRLPFSKKGPDGKPLTNANAKYAMTLKSKDHIYHLWEKIFKPICTDTHPHPWPNDKSGLPATQYFFSTRALPYLTELHRQWYYWSNEKNKFIKIVPLNIGDLLTRRGLAHWLMGDGFWLNSEKTVYICTDGFTLSEVELLVSVLKTKFNLDAGVNRRIKANKEVCWRIRLSAKSPNISHLISLVQPYFIPSMLYRLNILETDKEKENKINQPTNSGIDE